MRLIDADELLFRCNCLNHVAEFAIKRAPTVDAKPVVHAEWIENKLGYKCSNCRNQYVTRISMRLKNFIFCPYCGAKMDL